MSYLALADDDDEPQGYFSLREMRCKDGTSYPARYRNTRWPRLRETLNFIRSAWGHPINVTSGYRTPSYNRKVGGVRKSQHVEGRAADLVPRGGSAAQLHAVILNLYRAGKLPHLRGLGLYAGFVHVDVRPGKRLARWRG